MSRQIDVHEVKDKSGRRSALVELNINDGGWSGNYKIHTVGMTPEQVQAKFDAIVAHHNAKAARLEGFRAFNQQPKVNGKPFEVRVSITEQATDVRLILRVIAEDGETINLDDVYPDVASLPSDAEIATIVRDAATSLLNRRQIGQNHVNAVKQILGVG